MTLAILQGEPLAHYSRGGRRTDQAVFHESVTSTTAATVRVLRLPTKSAPKGKGAHIITDRAGITSQHVPFGMATVHAGYPGDATHHNTRSVGLECVNPYYEDHAPAGATVIDAAWAHRGRYCVPTPIQLERLWLALLHVLAEVPTIPLLWPAVGTDDFGRRVFPWGRIDEELTPGAENMPGIMSHCRWRHSDALFIEMYSLLRSLSRTPAEAFEETVAHASEGSATRPSYVIP